MKQYLPKEYRNQSMGYCRCGSRSIKLQALSPGRCHNVGHIDCLDNTRQIMREAWLLKDKRVTNVLIGESKASLKCLKNDSFNRETVGCINKILKGKH